MAPKSRKGASAANKNKKKKRKGPAKPASRRPAKARAAPKSAPYAEGKWAAAFAPRAPGERRYWLVKTEPERFSFDDLLRAPGRTTYWDGVRNTAARNFLRDGMKLGDLALFYHSNVSPQAIVGTCEVVREGYPDFTAFDRSHAHYDPESREATPMWYMVDMRAVARFAQPVTLPAIKAHPTLAGMALLRVGRLSVCPVTAAEWAVVLRLAEG